MAITTNLSNVSINSSGRVSFSGISSGIDFQDAVDKIIAAKQIPVDRLKTEVSTRDSKIAALEDLKDLLNALKSAVATLRGAVSVGGAGDAFKSKQAFASTTRTDGVTPSAAANLLGVSVTNAASTGSHTIEVLRTAKAHKIGSATFNSLSSDLGTARGLAANSISGSFDINGKTIQVLSTDTLPDLRDRINAANTGSSPTGVTASIVSISSTEHVLVLTSDKTGTPITLSNEVGGVLTSATGLGISDDGGTTLLNQLQKAETARFTADGLIDPDRFESQLILSDTALLNTYATKATYPGSFQITGGTGTATINYDATDSLQSLASKINLQTGTTGVTASVVADGIGYRLVLTEGANKAITLTDTSGLLADLGVDNNLVFERTSNTISDVFTGITLTLFQAEEGTKIKIDIEQNLSSIKADINSFVDAYNKVRVFLNTQQELDVQTLKPKDTAILFGSTTIREVETRLAQMVGIGVAGVKPEFSVLAQIGIDFVDNSALDDPLNADTLKVDTKKLDDALLKNPDDVRKLLSFDFSSSDPRVVLLDFTKDTNYNAAGFTLDITHDGTSVTAASLDGDPTAVSFSGNTITVTKGDATGLKLLYTGNTSVSGITLNYTTGIASEVSFRIEEFLDTSTGVLEEEIDQLKETNKLAQKKIDSQLERLERERTRLLARFARMEEALLSMNRILESINQITAAQQKKN